MSLEIASRLILDSQDYVAGIKAAQKQNAEIADSLKDINKAANDAEKGLDETADAVEGLKNEAKKAKPEVDEATESVSRFGKVNADTAKSAGKTVAKYTAVAAAIAAAVGYAFMDAATQAENYQIRLNRLLGSQEEGNRLFRDMAKFAGEVPFAYQEIMGAATQLSGVMQGGVDEINAWMPIIADLAAVSGLSIEQTTDQVVRMYSTGAQSAEMFKERGINSMLGFQAGVSYTAAETQKMLVEAFDSPTSKFRGAALDLAESWDGLLSMMGDKWFQFRTNLMDEGVFEYVKELAKIFNEQLGDGLSESENNAREWANTVMSGMGAVIMGGAHLMDFFGAINGTTNLLSNGVQTLYTKFLELYKVQLELSRLGGFWDDEFVAQVDAELARVDASIVATRERIEINNQQAYESFNKDWSAIAQTVIDRAEAAAAGAQAANDKIVVGNDDKNKRISAAELAAIAEQDAAQQAALEADLKRQDIQAKAAEDAYKRRVTAAERGLDAVDKATQTERQKVLAWYQESIDALDEAERLKLDSTRSYAELRADVEGELQQRLLDLDQKLVADRQLSLEEQFTNWSVFGDDLFDLYGDLGETWGDLMHGNSDDAKESFDQILDDLEDLLLQMSLRWLASGVSEWFNGGGTSGFTWDAFLGTSGGSDAAGLASMFAGALTTEQGQQVVGQAIGNEAAESLSNGLQTGGNVVGGAGSLYSGYNQIDAGLDQGGTDGALSVASGAASMYRGGRALYDIYQGYQAAQAGQAVAASAELAAGFSELSASVSALPETIAVASETIEGTTLAIEATSAETAATSASSASAALGATAAWIAVGMAADQAFNDGRVTNAFAGEYEARSDAFDELLDGNFATFRDAQFTAGYDAVKATFAARPFDQILVEDFLPELFGNSAAEFSALGAEGGTGFAGGNQGVFGNNFGVAGSGLSAQLLVDGGENGNGGFFTGAQESIDAFAAIAEEAGFRVQAANGVLEIMSDTQTVDDIKALWQAYSDGIDETVANTEIFRTAYENNLIQPTNLLYENINLATGLNADAARDALLRINESFDELVKGGAEGSQALIASLVSVFEISEEQAVQFVSRSGVELDQWLANFSDHSDEQLREMLDFNEQGLTLFEDAAAATSGTIDGIAESTAASFGGAVDDMRRRLQALNSEGSAVSVNALPVASGQGPIQSFDVGTPRIERDGLAMVHKDEMIIDPASANALRRYGIQGGAGGMGSVDVQAVNRLIEVIERNTNQSLATQRSLRNRNKNETKYAA